jgi:hypothetical protein
MTFTDMEYAGAVAEDSMEGIIPWAEFIEAIGPFYPKSGAPGRQPRGIEMMLRMCFLQVWFNLADEALAYMTDKEIFEAGLVVVPDVAEVPPPA